VTKFLVQADVFRSSPFVLVDVGASGGIEQHWRVFEPYLTAFGFEPLVKECERLNNLEQSSAVRYLPFFVGDENYDKLLPPSVVADPKLGWNNDVYPRTSAVRAQNLMSMSFTQRFNNEDPEIILTDQRTSLDRFFATSDTDTVDFVKVDTDGHDYEVLSGARRLASDKEILGFFVECQLHGINHPHANVFANIDRLMRELGFSLFDFEIYRYTRAALPGHFVYDIPAQTHEGQVLWGDALFLRDVTADAYESRWLALPPLKLLKLICLHEIFGMPDCAAEILLKQGDKLKILAEPAPLLDMLTQEIDPAHTSYHEYNAKFDESPQSFYPQPVAESPPASENSPLTKNLSVSENPSRFCRLKTALVKQLRRLTLAYNSSQQR
jgi:FkbM family methyltransferase